MQKLAEYLARFARARPNSSADLSVAIATWKSDLEYLKETFYDGKFDFPWPNTTEDPLRDDLLRQEAIRRGEEGERGWVTPEGVFFEADETDPTWPHGLGGHERAALCWLEANRRDLLDSLKKEIKAAGFERFEDTRGTNMVKKFMFRNGFWPVAPDLEIDYWDRHHIARLYRAVLGKHPHFPKIFAISK